MRKYGNMQISKFTNGKPLQYLRYGLHTCTFGYLQIYTSAHSHIYTHLDMRNSPIGLQIKALFNS